MKPAVDWDQVAIDIRAGILTDRQIGAKHGRTHGAIQSYARKHGIERNLGERIAERTETKLAKKLAKTELAKEISQKNARISTDQIVEVAAEARSMIVIAQQGRIGRHLGIAANMLAELESQTIDRELYDKLGEMMFAPDANGVDRLNALYQKVIDTPSRIDSHKKAVEIEKNLIALERQAFGLDGKQDDANSSIESVIKRVRDRLDGQ